MASTKEEILPGDQSVENDHQAAQQLWSPEFEKEQEINFDADRELLMKNKMSGSHEDLARRYRPLRSALRHRDWKQVEDFINKNPDALKANLGNITGTFFHLIVWHTDKEAIRFMKKYLQTLGSPKSALEQIDNWGNTALSQAAAAGNTEAAKILVKYNDNLPNIRDKGNLFPIHMAALYGHKETVQYLLSVTSVEDSNKDLISPFFGLCGLDLLIRLIKANIYDIAFDLLKRHPALGRDQNEYRGIILQMLSEKPKAFASGSRLGYLQRLIYHCIPVHGDHDHDAHQTRKTDSFPSETDNRDEENQRPEDSIIKKSDFFSNVATTLVSRFAFRVPKSSKPAMPPQKAKPCNGSLFDKFQKSYKSYANKGVFIQKLPGKLWNAFMWLAPFIKDVHDTKLMHMQTVGIVRMMLSDADESLLSFEVGTKTLKEPAFAATKFGIHEIVEEISEAFSDIDCWIEQNGNKIFMLAVLHRQEKILKHFYQTDVRGGISPWTNNDSNNVLHLAGKLVPSSDIPGAALQMQRELQWFKLVESMTPASLGEERNVAGETPIEVFTKEHIELVKEGEKWMKETASSCTLVASLIITVVFAAAFTVPGGSNGESGIPIFLREKSFIVFAISDALALFSSTTSLLMFLGILTSRYLQEDFLVSLPNKLIIGLITLFFSIASMMVAFGATINILLSNPWKWVIFPIALLGCLPVTLFTILQFPLLLEMILSTYGHKHFQPIK